MTWQWFLRCTKWKQERLEHEKFDLWHCCNDCQKFSQRIKRLIEDFNYERKNENEHKTIITARMKTNT